MGLTLADTYYLKAKGATNGFSSDWEEVCEALNYALSYDKNHCASLCLLGTIYAEHFRDYEKAFDYFDQVIAIDINYLEVYYAYAKYLIWADKIGRTQKLIDFAFGLKGIGKAEMYWLSAYALETKGHYKIALQLLKKAKIESYNENYTYFLKDEVTRVRQKIKLTTPKSKKPKKK
ncbi:tetratricopeptide repeat protein [Aquimarina agarilytica]|uniref:tetratricopeptide repeat protein n=1 Tax=Aquimarina agarilytica TaxID=1087449 RepID=UPI0002893FF7|nr:peptide chain release factor [Aquimarina agarilytica]